MSTRSRNVLLRERILTLGDLASQRRSTLSGIPNLGAQSLSELEQLLRTHGLSFAAEPEKPTRPERELDERALDMVTRRRCGETLGQIGDAHGVSRERVRQILGVAAPSASEIRENRTLLRRAEADGRRQQILAAFRRGDTPAEIARVLSLDALAVREVLGESVTAKDRAARRGNRAHPVERRFSDEDLIESIRQVAERFGRAPTAQEYARAARAEVLPSLPTIHNRLGWSRAVELAGYSPRKRRTYTRRWTEQACRRALQRVTVECSGVPTAREYDILAQLDESLPSLATVRNRLGWARITAELAGLPSREDALSHVEAIEPGQRRLDPALAWIAYLEEALTREDLVVLLLSGDLVWNEELGPPPEEIADLVADIALRASGPAVELHGTDASHLSG